MSAILLAGFGGQGILFAGKQLAAMGMETGKQVSWLPSYGPEMRGGTCNCSVNIDDEPIGSPLVLTPDILIAFNKPSYQKFIGSVVAGGTVFADSTLIDCVSDRSDITEIRIPTSKLASDNGIDKLANVIMLGRLIRVTGIFDYESFKAHLIASSPKSKPQLAELNAKALEIGYNYAE